MSGTIKGDEIWIHGYDSETKQQSWQSPQSPGARKDTAGLEFNKIKKGRGEARGSLVVKALCYKPEGRGFDTR
jgi:hypothetical protein